jgi:hypothetical protein
LEFHHGDPGEKEKGLGGLRASVRSWKKIVEEAKKCVLVCGVCHAEIHAGMRVVPTDATRFNPEYEEYKIGRGEMNSCPVCGSPKPTDRVTCSARCGRSRSWSVKWGDIDLPGMLKSMSVQEVADSLGISNGAVRKRMKKLGLIHG